MSTQPIVFNGAYPKGSMHRIAASPKECLAGSEHALHPCEMEPYCLAPGRSCCCMILESEGSNANAGLGLCSPQPPNTSYIGLTGVAGWKESLASASIYAGQRGTCSSLIHE